MPDRDADTKAMNRELDEALEDTFPASDPPSMTSPVAATASAGDLHPHGHGGEVRVYRIVPMADASDPFGGSDKGGRWTSPGKACVYAARTPAGALLEFLAHLDGTAPPGPVAMAVGVVPEGAVIVQSNEPSGWPDRPYRDDVRQVGDAWLDEARSHALMVPSALCPDEWNVLLNPAHGGHAVLRLLRLQPLELDGRLGPRR